ncbi:MAG TPA: sulfite dehydrogenase [Candidatus Acidoferrales bacterium]|nr:sulfite dehydrogenase [Candidatus Acidoferrales bacterium]
MKIYENGGHIEKNGGGRTFSRRRLLSSAAELGALALLPRNALPQQPGEVPHELGLPKRPYGYRSPFESKVVRSSHGHTPLQDLYGIITPSELHYEVLHFGMPMINPAHHELLIDGLVERPLIFTMKDLERMPAVSEIHFLECAGNSGADQDGFPGKTPQESHGQMSCTEWTGVRLSTVLEQVGLKPTARWILAEGADAGRLARSIPVEKALDDIIVAYGQNGEALRPEQGYPVRLVVPGWEGNTNIKWLHRLQVLEQPAMTAWETGSYTDLLPSGKARQFTFVMEAKSVITRPAGGQRLDGPGVYEITGVAWSGRGKINSVEISADGGQNWQKAELQEPILTKAFTRFRWTWNWNGAETKIASRCTDETGYCQPTREQIVAVRGLNATDHYNGIKWWRVHRDGEVTYA